MAKIIAPQISSKYFHYHKEDKCFTAEASDLPDSFNFLSQIYDDACDKGFSMVGQKTGIIVTFHYANCDYNKEREVVGWNFKPIAESIRKNPKLAKVTVLIIND